MRTFRAFFVICVAMSFGGLVPAGAVAKPSSHPFEIVPGSFHVLTSTGQAAAHADWTVSFDFAHEGEGAQGDTFNDGRTTIVNLPPGFIGNNTAVPTCSVAELVGNEAIGEPGNPVCDPASQVGTISFDVDGALGFEEVLLPIYNMEVTDFGVTAELGFNYAGAVVQTLAVSVRPDDSGITVTSANIERTEEFRDVKVTTWGLPASHVHDPQRGLECYTSHSQVCSGGNESVNIPIEPFLSNPTSCVPHIATMEADSWEHPEDFSKAETEVTPSVECGRVPFDPSLEVQPTTRFVESSSGLNVSLVVPQTWENPSGIATSNLKDTVLALPVGYTANPSLASGLGVCTPAQFHAETSSSTPGTGCPEESKIGTVVVETPVLAEKVLTGNIFIAKPFENPFDSLLGLYIVVKDPQRGIIVKLAGRIEPNPVTGQLVTTFDENPQVPFSRFTLKLRQGASSPLVSPPVCGHYTATSLMEPWSHMPAPDEALGAPDATPTSSFDITQGIGGGPCPSGGVPPFHPQVISGTENNAAGSYSPFYLRIDREDGEQEITKFSTTMPPGLSGNLTGIPFCPEADIQHAREQTGAEAEAQPACPAASEVGRSITEAGVGAVLAQTPGKIYLAGPYHGAPLSLVSVTSAKVGPFDLGTVVIRFALDINPSSAQVEVSAAQSDPIPHIIDGIVVHVRNVRVYIDRPGFTLNPTSCERMSIQEAITGAGQDPTNPADQDTVDASAPFQAADCSSLQFAPKFSASASAKTSRLEGANLSVKLSFPDTPQGTQSNIHQVKVELPRQLPSRLPTLQKACTKAQFDTNPAGCPPASIVGHAKATTPILPVPLEGPAYFVSNGGEAWPNLIIVLQGYGLTIDLLGDTLISKQGVTSSTFKTVPDQPVTSFELTLPEGPYSALAALGNLCTLTKTVTVKKKVTTSVHGHRRTSTRKIKQTKRTGMTMPTEFVAQNGAVTNQETPVTVTGCPKDRAAKKTKTKHRHAK